MASDPLNAFRTQLAEAGRDYLLDLPPDGDQARIRFIGPFEGREVIWRAHVRSLRSVARASPDRVGQGLRNFIRIAAEGADEIELETGLAVEQVNASVVLMAIKMIRKYKRLARGLHEYGERHRFAV